MASTTYETVSFYINDSLFQGVTLYRRSNHNYWYSQQVDVQPGTDTQQNTGDDLHAPAFLEFDVFFPISDEANHSGPKDAADFRDDVRDCNNIRVTKPGWAADFWRLDIKKGLGIGNIRTITVAESEGGTPQGMIVCTVRVVPVDASFEWSRDSDAAVGIGVV